MRSEQLDIFAGLVAKPEPASVRPTMEACFSMLRRAFEIADKDGSFDNLSANSRSLIARAFFPPPGGYEEIVKSLQSEIEWTKALLDAYKKQIEAIAEIAANVRAGTGEKNIAVYNRHGYRVPNTDLDIQAIRAALKLPAPAERAAPVDMEDSHG